MKVTIDEVRCTGAGQCVFAAPTVFDQRDDDGIVVLLQEHPSDELSDAVEDAVMMCPAAAIRTEK